MRGMIINHSPVSCSLLTYTRALLLPLPAELRLHAVNIGKLRLSEVKVLCGAFFIATSSVVRSSTLPLPRGRLRPKELSLASTWLFSEATLQSF